MELFKEYAGIGQRINQLHGHEKIIELFEEELKNWLPEGKLLIIFTKINIAKTNKEYAELNQEIEKMLGTEKRTMISCTTEEYIGCLKKVDEMQVSIDRDTMELVQKMRLFMKKSIS